MADGGPLLNDNLKDVSWLLGKWRTESAKGKYPTIKEFEYGEEVEFMHVGQPNLQYSAYAWNLGTKKPMHREVGFLKVKAGTKEVALVIAQNIGTCEVEEGTVSGQSITTESHTLGRVSFNKPPTTTKICRVFSRDGNTLTQVVSMDTENTPMTEHLKAVYKRVE